MAYEITAYVKRTNLAERKKDGKKERKIEIQKDLHFFMVLIFIFLGSPIKYFAFRGPPKFQ